jgi:predicted Zn-dependent protease
VRRVSDQFGETQERDIDVFSLTGRVVLQDGRFISLAWSGIGNGLVRLQASAALELKATASAVEQASPTPGGVFAAILDYQPAAVLLHEAIGHFAEGSALPGTTLGHRLGCVLAPEWMTAHDNPRFGKASDSYFDDEGIESVSATPLLSGGMLAAQLHNNASARRAGVLSTGNARSAQVSQAAIPRLSNLMIGGGQAELDAMIAGMGDGFFVQRISDGYSRVPHVEARVILAERIKNGRRTGQFVTGGRIVENVDLFVRAIEATRTTQLNPNAMCGKHGQILYDVATIAPAVRLATLRFAA